MTEKQMYAEMEKIVREKMMSANSSGYKDGFRAGVIAVAQFAGTYDQQITGTEFKFEDLILLKFNLIGKRKPRRKVMRLRTLAEKHESQTLDGEKLYDLFDWPTLVYNALKAKGIVTVGDLTARTELEILQTQNIGKKSFRLIKDGLKEINRSFLGVVEKEDEYLKGIMKRRPR